TVQRTSPATSRPFFFFDSAHPRSLLPFPTRRSSDLGERRGRVRPRRRLHPGDDPSASQLGCSDRSGDVSNWPLMDPTTVSICGPDRKSTRLNSSHVKISYAVFCLKKKNKQKR